MKAAGGGIPARRAVVRWTWRLFRREWRQQTLLLVLLTLTVAAAVFGATAAYNLTPRATASSATPSAGSSSVAPIPPPSRPTWPRSRPSTAPST